MEQISQTEVLSCLQKFDGYSDFRKLGRMHGIYKNAAIVFFLNTSNDVEAYFLMPYMEGIDYGSVYDFIHTAKNVLKNPQN